MIRKIWLLTCYLLLVASLHGQVNLLNKFVEKKHGVLFCTYSSNGEYIVTSGNDNNIVIWNAASGTLYKKLSGIDKLTKSLRVSCDGTVLVSGSKNFKVTVWDIARGDIKFFLSGHSGDVNSVDISSDGRYVVSGSSDRSIKIWDARNGQLLKTFIGNSKEVNSVMFNSLGSELVSASADGSIRIWDVHTGKILRTLDGMTWVRCIQISPDGTIIASCGDDNKVKIWDYNSGLLKKTLVGHKAWVQSLSFSPDGRYLVSGSHDQSFIVWNVQTGIIDFQSPKQEDVVYSVSFNPNGKTIATTNLFKNEFNIWDVAALNVMGSMYASAPNGEQTKVVAQITEQPLVISGSPDIQIKGLIFYDPNRNNLIDADEQSSIEFIVHNRGNAIAKNLRLQIKELANVYGISFKPFQSIGDLSQGQEKKVVIPILASSALVSGKALFNLTILEDRGFDSSPVELAIVAKQQENPLLVVQDYRFMNSGNEKIAPGSKVKLKVVVQNRGYGLAKNVNVRFNLPENTFIVTEPDYYIAEMEPNAIKTLDLELMTNKRYNKPELTLDIVVSETTGKFGQQKTISTPFEGRTPAGNVVNVLPNEKTNGGIAITDFSLSSDVDKDIPVASSVKKNIYALIIGNEDYNSYQQGLSSEVNVEYAKNDAQVFKEYVNKTLGVPNENITLLLDAKLIEMNRSIEKLNLIAKNTNGDCELIFYYAGHGLPDEVTHEAYVMPVDVSGTDLKFAIQVKYIYKKLTQYPTKRVTVFLDACFSGGARSNALIAARGVKVRPKADGLNGNIVVFSASSGEQSSLPYKEKQHGIFTYFILKKLQETGGDVSYTELSEYIQKEVSLKSVIINNKEQNPQVNTGATVKDAWESWKIK